MGLSFVRVMIYMSLLFDLILFRLLNRYDKFKLRTYTIGPKLLQTTWVLVKDVS